MHSARQCWRRASRLSYQKAYNHVSAQEQSKHANAIIDNVTEASTIGKLQDQGGLSGRTIAVKDNIVTFSAPTTAASRILSAHQSPFEATVVKILKDDGAKISSKTNLDEFGMGSHSQDSYDGPVLSPFRRNGVALSPGGSSGGSAIAVATDKCWAALGTDTGGSVRLPAAYVGIVGFKPSYGLLSRWGVIQYANSLDTVGVLANTTKDAAMLFRLLNQYDSQDPTSLTPAMRLRLQASRTKRSSRLRIGIPVEYNIAELSPAVRSTYASTLLKLQSQGHTIQPISLPTTRQALSAYYVLAPAEASSNLAKYDGIRYGFRSPGSDASSRHRLPLYSRTRGEGFGDEVKRRILLGAYTLSSEAISNYFIQAQKVRRLVQQDFDQVYARLNPLLDSEGVESIGQEAKVDLILTPTAPTLPPTVEEVKSRSPIESYMNDVFTVPASLAGLPAASVPVRLPDTVRATMEESDVKTAGMQVIGQFGDDELVLEFAEIIEKLHY